MDEPPSVRPHEVLKTGSKGKKSVQFFPLEKEPTPPPEKDYLTFDALQWEPTRRGAEAGEFVPFQPRDGRWLCGREVHVQEGSSLLEVKDSAPFWSGASPRTGGEVFYYWDQGPGGVGGGLPPFHAAVGGLSIRTAQRWRVPLEDIQHHEQFCFSVPVLLAFNSSGSLITTMKDEAGDGAASVVRDHDGGKDPAGPRWIYRLWGPVGLVITLLGGVQIFLVFKTSEEVERFGDLISHYSTSLNDGAVQTPRPPRAPAPTEKVGKVTWATEPGAVSPDRTPVPAFDKPTAQSEEAPLLPPPTETETLSLQSNSKSRFPRHREWPLYLKPHGEKKSFVRYYFYLPKRRNPHTENDVPSYLYDSQNHKKKKRSSSILRKTTKPRKHKKTREESLLLASPMPSNVMFISQRRRGVWKRLAHTLFGKETLPDDYLGIDLVHTTLSLEEEHTHRFSLESVVFTTEPERFAEMASVHPLEDYGSVYEGRTTLIKTKPYLIQMDVLAPTSYQRDWWVEELQALGAVISDSGLDPLAIVDHPQEPPAIVNRPEERPSIVQGASPPPATPPQYSAPVSPPQEVPRSPPSITIVKPALPIQEEFDSSTSESFSDAVNAAAPVKATEPLPPPPSASTASQTTHTTPTSGSRPALVTVPYSYTSESSPPQSTPSPLRRTSSNIYSQDTQTGGAAAPPDTAPPPHALFVNGPSAVWRNESAVVREDSAVLPETFHTRTASPSSSSTQSPRPSQKSAREIAVEAVMEYRARHSLQEDDTSQSDYSSSEAYDDRKMPDPMERAQETQSLPSSVSEYRRGKVWDSVNNDTKRNLSALLASPPKEYGEPASASTNEHGGIPPLYNDEELLKLRRKIFESTLRNI